MAKKQLRKSYKKKYSQEKDKFYTKEDIFISRIASILQMPKARTKGLFYNRIASVIRINTLAGDKDKIVKLLLSKGLDLEEIPWLETAYIVKNMDKSDLGDMHEYAKGLFYIQGISSMVPVKVLNPTDGERVLDMCAAPGSKTTQIAARMHNKGEVAAAETDFKRAQRLSDVLNEFHVKNAEVIHTDSTQLYKTYQNYFHKILLDAPCSGEGMIYLNSPNPLRFWSIKKVKAMASLQKKLIDSAYLALRPGGTLVYSTCTLEPMENEEVVSYLLNKHSDARIVPIDFIDEPSFKEYKKLTANGITHWSDQSYHQEVHNTLRILPSPLTQGFYIAQIHKPKAAHS